MTPDHAAYLAAIERESARFRDLLADADPQARVPSCPDWDAADLLWHHTEVQAFWTHVLRHRPQPPEDYEEPPRPESYAELLTTYERTRTEFIDTLRQADPGEPAWSWHTDQTVGFTYRRQAHEALIHRVDAEETVGARTDLDPVLASDGVAEVLDTMLGGYPEWATWTPGGQRVRVLLSDTGAETTVELGRFSGTGPESGKVYDDPTLLVLEEPVTPDVTVRGPAAVVNTWLWRRGDAQALEQQLDIEGDRDVFERFRRVLQPIE
jgi:uncharacterized protein (TIGR03083 family)